MNKINAYGGMKVCNYCSSGSLCKYAQHTNWHISLKPKLRIAFKGTGSLIHLSIRIRHVIWRKEIVKNVK